MNDAQNGQPLRVSWRPAAVLLVIWSVSFAGLSAYWAAGGTALVEVLSPTIQRLAAVRAPAFVTLVWGSVIFKLGYALIVIATHHQPRGTRSRRFLIGVGFTVGFGTVAYAIAEAALAATSSDSSDPWPLWYLLLWDPVWALGGLLLVLVTIEYRRCSLPQSSPIGIP